MVSTTIRSPGRNVGSIESDGTWNTGSASWCTATTDATVAANASAAWTQSRGRSGAAFAGEAVLECRGANLTEPVTGPSRRGCLSAVLAPGSSPDAVVAVNTHFRGWASVMCHDPGA